MSKINNEVVETLSTLSRLGLSSEEAEKIQGDLEKILNFISTLDGIDTEGVPPTYHVAKELVNVSRPDNQFGSEVAKEELLDRATFLKNAPDQVAGMVRVPSFMGGKEE